MKKSLLILAAAGASLLSAGFLLGQSASAAAPAAQKQQRLVRVSVLNTKEANQEFQNNVQVMQARRQELIDANTTMEKETNAAKKKELKAKVDSLFSRLAEDNQKMLKAYGFTLERNYIVVPVVSEVHMLVTEEEAARIEKEQAAATKKK